MKKTITTALIAATALTLAACGGATTTENVTVSNEAVIEDGGDNLTAVDTVNESGVAIGNSDDALTTENAVEATNATE